MKSNAVKVKLNQIRTDVDAWARAAIDRAAVEDYAEVYRSEFGKSQMPEVVLFRDGDVYWIGDGKHRCLAALAAEQKDIWAIVENGTERDANIYSAECNRTHGVRRSYKDAEKLVRCMLADDEWAGKSIMAIAKKCGLSHSFVDRIRKKENQESGVEASASDKVTGSDGKQYPAHRREKIDPEPDCISPQSEEPADGSHTSTTTPAQDQVLAREPEKLNHDEQVLDGVDNPVPPGLVSVFTKAREFKVIINQLNEIGRNLEEMSKYAAGACLSLQATKVDIASLKRTIRFDMPYCVCQVCQGDAKNRKANCPCKDRGWLTEAGYEKLPQEFRK